MTNVKTLITLKRPATIYWPGKDSATYAEKPFAFMRTVKNLVGKVVEADEARWRVEVVLDDYNSKPSITVNIPFHNMAAWQDLEGYPDDFETCPG